MALVMEPRAHIIQLLVVTHLIMQMLDSTTLNGIITESRRQLTEDVALPVGHIHTLGHKQQVQTHQ